MNVESGGVRPISADEPEKADARGKALECMLKALEHLDSDGDISPVIGSQLQLAIDRLASSNSGSSRKS